MIDIGTLRGKFETEFNTPLSGSELDRLDDVLKAASFLTDFDEMAKALKKLNASLVTNLGGKPAVEATANHYKEMAQWYESKAKQNKSGKVYGNPLPTLKEMKEQKPVNAEGALSRTFSGVETLSGFAQRTQILTKFVGPEVFAKQLVRNWHWKDPTVNAKHGELTHRIQWYCILVGANLADAAATFAFLTKPYGGPQKTKIPHTLWDWVCDRNGGDAPFIIWKSAATENNWGLPTDFRSPEILHAFLLDSQKNQASQDLSPLNIFLKQRRLKRTVFEIDKNYVSRKLYKKNYVDLTGDEQEYVKLRMDVGSIFDPEALDEFAS